jgi:hypothetical protein
MAYGHHIKRIGNDHYRLSWTIDRKVAGSRLRFPTTTTRDTDSAGALRFVKKWKLDIPDELKAEAKELP